MPVYFRTARLKKNITIEIRTTSCRTAEPGGANAGAADCPANGFPSNHLEAIVLDGFAADWNRLARTRAN